MGNMEKIIHRLRRLEGQVRGVTTQIESDAKCDDVLVQLLALRGSLDGVLQAYIDKQLESCKSADVDQMRELLRTLLKHKK